MTSKALHKRTRSTSEFAESSSTTLINSPKRNRKMSYSSPSGTHTTRSRTTQLKSNKKKNEHKLNSDDLNKALSRSVFLLIDNNDKLLSPGPPSPPRTPIHQMETDNNYKVVDDEPLLLTNVVWINTRKHGWWPAEITSNDKYEKPLRVQLFGNIIQKIMELYDTSNVHIRPFRCDLSSEFRYNGENSNMRVIFKEAVSEAEEKETEDNDGLPSEDWAIHKVVDSAKLKERRKMVKKKKGINTLRRIYRDEFNGSTLDKSSSDPLSITQNTSNITDYLDKDESLMIPGELVLACAHKKYYPAKILSYTEPDKYRIEFCDDTIAIVSRKKFFTKYEDGFQTCQLGDVELDKEDPDYYDPKLIKQIHSLEDVLSRVLTGAERSAWRYQDFFEGGKKRNLLAEKVSPGPFNLSEFTLIAKTLRGMFIPDIAESIDRETKILSPTKNKRRRINESFGTSLNAVSSSTTSELFNITDSAFYSLSKNAQLRFINDVMLPEAIIRIIMCDEGFDYESAENQMLTGYAGWVESLIAERTSFQVGRESLLEKA